MVQKVKVTLDNVSPLIEYSPKGAWRDGRAADEFWQSYDNGGTFTLTTTYGASATLTFNGTGVWIYGAKRANHGPYNATLDGRTFTDDGFYKSQLFQQVLFSGVELDGTKPHTVSITNSFTDTERPYLDIDSIVYQVEIPDDYQEVKHQDFVGAFNYSSPGWSKEPENLASYDSGTGHATSLGDAYVDYTFEGSLVELHGMVGSSGGLYTVQLDNGLSKTFNASGGKLSPQAVLYQNSGLGPGKHTMRITNAPFSGQTLGIDYAVIRRPSNITDTDGDSSPPSLGGGAIGGIVAGICGLIIIIMAGLFFLYRRRHRRPGILPQEVLQAEFTTGDDDRNAAGSPNHLTPFLLNTRYPAASPPGPLPPSSTGYDSPGQIGPSFYQTTHQLESGSPSASRLALHNVDSVAVGSRSPFEGVDEKRRLGMRERDPQAEGRARDFGPVTFASGNDEGLLPPDYHQATRPFITETR